MDNVYHIQLPRDTHLQNVKEHYQKNKEEMQKKGRTKKTIQCYQIRTGVF